MSIRLEIGKPTIHQRALKAFADFAILIALKNQAMTAYGINNYFIRKIGIAASPSTIYSDLVSMERKGWIECVRNQNGRSYALTPKGREIASNISSINNEIINILKTLFLVY